MDPHLARIKAELQEVRNNYVAELPARIKSIENLWHDYSRQGSADTLQELIKLVHSMSGSGGLFGIQKLSESAREFEQHLLRIKDGSQTADGDETGRMLAELREAADTDEAGANPWQPENKKVYVYAGDGDHANVLGLQLSQFGYSVHVFMGLQELESALTADLPDVLLLDMVAPDAIEQLDQLKEHGYWRIPVACISTRDTFAMRLQIARLGGESFMTDPTEITPLLECLDEWTKEPDLQPYRILVVVANQKLAQHYGLLLKNAGMEAAVCTVSENVINDIAVSAAELLVVDEKMPECSGVELVKLARQAQAYRHIPALFLSSQPTLEKKFMDLRMGGDDFLSKPIDDVEFTNAVKIRAERARSQNKYMTRDTLTGALKHSSVVEQLEKEFSRARRLNSKLAFVLVNVSELQTINERFGHVNGDRVLKVLARMFVQRLRKSDSLGRYAGSEFALLLPECDKHSAERVVREVMEGFSCLQFSHNEATFSARFKAFVCDNQAFDSAPMMVETAERSLLSVRDSDQDIRVDS